VKSIQREIDSLNQQEEDAKAIVNCSSTIEKIRVREMLR